MAAAERRAKHGSSPLACRIKLQWLPSCSAWLSSFFRNRSDGEKKSPGKNAEGSEIEASGDSFQELRELRGRPELRQEFEFLERARKRVREAPHCPRLELGVPRVEVEAVDRAVEVVRDVDLRLYERAVDDELRRGVGELALAPAVDLLHHGLEVPLHLVHADADGLDQVEVLAVLREHRFEGAMNNIGKLPFEFSALISRGMLKPVRGSGIVAF